MCVIGTLVALSILIAVFGTYRAAMNTGRSSDTGSWRRSRPKSPRLHFVSKEVNTRPHTSEPHHIVFHLQGIEPSIARKKGLPQAPGLSLSELEKCIPWIPMDSAIFISSGGGFSPSMLDRIKGLETSRDLYLIDANASEARSTAVVEA